jgi:hypothetical protein
MKEITGHGSAGRTSPAARPASAAPTGAAGAGRRREPRRPPRYLPRPAGQSARRRVSRYPPRPRPLATSNRRFGLRQRCHSGSHRRRWRACRPPLPRILCRDDPQQEHPHGLLPGPRARSSPGSSSMTSANSRTSSRSTSPPMSRRCKQPPQSRSSSSTSLRCVCSSTGSWSARCSRPTPRMPCARPEACRQARQNAGADRGACPDSQRQSRPRPHSRPPPPHEAILAGSDPDIAAMSRRRHDSGNRRCHSGRMTAPGRTCPELGRSSPFPALGRHRRT